MRSRPHLFFALLCLTLVAAACDDDDVGAQGGNDTSTAQDTTADTGPTDTATGDTAAPDTASGDTTSGDTGGNDTTIDTAEGDAPGDDVTGDTAADDTTSPTDTVTPPTELYISTGDSYASGALTVLTTALDAGQADAPVDLVIYTPTESGRYAVVVFQHGFVLPATAYSEVLTHLASHGFIVVAPQMYPTSALLDAPSAAEEAQDAAALHAWLTENLSTQLAPDGSLVADPELRGVSGHSRGGKVNWLLLTADPTLADAMALLDPVDGTGGPFGGEARAIDGTLAAMIPTLIVGTGLGPTDDGGPLSMPCAPDGDNHVQFYANTPAPSWHVVATEQGHNDMLDADADCGFACSACITGSDPAGMRTLSAGLLTAFFRATLQGDATQTAVLGDVMGAPIAITTEQRP